MFKRMTIAGVVAMGLMALVAGAQPQPVHPALHEAQPGVVPEVAKSPLPVRPA